MFHPWLNIVSWPRVAHLRFARMPVIKCVECGQKFDSDSSPTVPFCSLRCKQLDLRRWLDEEYSVPVEDEESSAEGENGDAASS